MRFGVDEDLLEDAEELHERSVEFLQLRRSAEDGREGEQGRRRTDGCARGWSMLVVLFCVKTLWV